MADQVQDTMRASREYPGQAEAEAAMREEMDRRAGIEAGAAPAGGTAGSAVADSHPLEPSNGGKHPEAGQ